jgi:hypothetical protein
MEYNANAFDGRGRITDTPRFRWKAWLPIFDAKDIATLPTVHLTCPPFSANWSGWRLRFWAPIDVDRLKQGDLDEWRALAIEVNAWALS